MSKRMTCRHTSFPSTCRGCRSPFPQRAGHAEAIIGHDGHLYCYAGRPDCLARAFEANAGKAA
jgi:hypothetical protein